MLSLLSLITMQALLGGVDNLWHHEITERLPARRVAARELSLHAARELIYAFAFLALAWFRWQGIWALLLGAGFVLDVVITLADFVVEDKTRRLPPLERVLHTVLAINFGAVLMLLLPVLAAWWELPTAVVVNPAPGAFAAILTTLGVGVFAWSVRNALAVLRLRRPPEWVRNPITAGVAASPRTVLISGATGFIGGHLTRRLIERGERVIVLTRDAAKGLDRFGPHVQIITSVHELEPVTRVDAIANLAGASIFGFPWTRRRRAQLIGSRVETTRALVALAGRLTNPPRVLVSASAIGYYGLQGDAALDERSPPSPVFQSRLCQEWEAAADAAVGLGVRVVKLRIGLVMGSDGGSLPQLARPHRFGLGAVLGSGQQWMSWIHVGDLIRLFEFVLDTPAARGAINAVAPAPLIHSQMQRTLASVLHRPLWLRVPGFVLRGTLGEMAQLLLDGQRVVPASAVALGFEFHYPQAKAALTHLLRGPRAAPAATAADIYFNGDCPVCRTEMGHYARRCAEVRPDLRFIDSMRRPNDLAQCHLRLEHLQRRVYLRDAGGHVISGMPALIALWSQVPGYRPLARILSWPVLRPVSVLLYDHLIAPALAYWASRRSAGECPG
jgi:uncharacterized protein